MACAAEELSHRQMCALADFEQALGASHLKAGAGKRERGGIESTVRVDPYQPLVRGAERADVDFRRVAWCTQRQRAVKPRATAVAGAVQEHEKAAVAARDEDVDSPVVVDVGSKVARPTSGGRLRGLLPREERECTSWFRVSCRRPGAASRRDPVRAARRQHLP